MTQPQTSQLLNLGPTRRLLFSPLSPNFSTSSLSLLYMLRHHAYMHRSQAHNEPHGSFVACSISSLGLPTSISGPWTGPETQRSPWAASNPTTVWPTRTPRVTTPRGRSACSLTAALHIHAVSLACFVLLCLAGALAWFLPACKLLVSSRLYGLELHGLRL